MDKYLVTPTTVLPGDVGDSFPEIKETDLSRVGQAAMEGDSAIVDDFIIKTGGLPAILGGDFLLAGGLGIYIAKPLRVWRGSDGKQFSDHASTLTLLELEPADEAETRIDLICAILTEDVDAALETRHFKKDPANPASLEGDAAMYTEKRNQATGAVVTGTPASLPSPPALPLNSVPMYYVTVRAGATSIVAINVNDVRHNFLTLEECSDRIKDISAEVDTIGQAKHRHPATDVDVAAPANRVGDNAQEVLNYLVTRSDEDIVDPVIRPHLIRHDSTPIAPSNIANGKLGSVGVVDGSIPAIDVPVGREMSFFGSATRKFDVGSFPATVEGVSINARIVNKSVDAATQSRSNQIELRLSNVDSIESDGGGDWANLNASAPAPISSHQTGRRVVARDDRYIEIFGGVGVGDSSWTTFDTQTKTYTARSFSGTIPVYPIRVAAPCGNGTALIMTAEPDRVRWFVVNLTSGATVEKTGPDAGNEVSGAAIAELIQTNIIFVVAQPAFASVWPTLTFSIFHVETGVFENFTPTGGPLSAVQHGLIGVQVCLYQQGQALLIIDNHPSAGRLAKTYVFDYNTRGFSTLSLPLPPTGSSALSNGYELANVSGRPLLMFPDTGPLMAVWELTPSAQTPQWRQLTTGLPARSYPGLVSLLPNGLPNGKGYFFGGYSADSAWGLHSDAWGFAAGGIVETMCGGVTGLTLGPGATQATFRVTSMALPWTVGTVLASLVGNYSPGSVKIAYSFDNGATRIEVPLSRLTTIVGSPANPTPLVYVTLIGSGDSAPCVSKLNELFEQSGGGAPGLTSAVIRFNVVTAGVRYLYINRAGVITIETTAQQTTVDKALLAKITPTGGSSAPTPFDFINLRLIHRKYTETRAGGNLPSVSNDFPVLPSYIRCIKVESDGTLKNLADPTITFNTPIAVSGLTTDGQAFILEMEA